MKRSWQQHLIRVLFVAMAATLAVLVVNRLRVFRLPGSMPFKLIVLMIALPTMLWWAWVDQRLTRVMRSPGSVGGWRYGLRVAVAIYAVMVLGPVFMLLARWFSFDDLPVSAIMYTMLWHLMMTLTGMGLVVFGGAWLAVCLARRVCLGDAVTGTEQQSDGPKVDHGRRALLAHAVCAAPMVIAGTTTLAGLSQAGKFHVRRHAMLLAGLPERLRGLTITHLCDMHVGRLFRPEHLGRMVEAANKLNSDLVVVTGDMLDHSIDYLPDVCDALGQLEHRYGRYVVVGNHDLIDSPIELMKYLRNHEPGLLFDRHETRVIGGETLQIAGLFWSRHDDSTTIEPGHAQRAGRALALTDRSAFTIGLAHHPHAFEALAERGVNLTLSGHTHGGQIMLTHPRSVLPIGGGLMFRYIWGEYRLGNSAMYVNAGVGNWFPVRYNAPAEMVQIQLI